MKIWSVVIKQETISQRTSQKSLKNLFCRIGLDLDDCRGQGYDEACNMKGRLSGGEARITSECSNAIFIHCFRHSLNLAAQNCSK